MSGRFALAFLVALLVGAPALVRAQADAGVDGGAGLDEEIEHEDEAAEAVEPSDEDEDQVATDHDAYTEEEGDGEGDADTEAGDDDEGGGEGDAAHEGSDDEGRPGMGAVGVTASFLEPPRATGSSDFTLPLPPLFIYDHHGPFTTTAVFPGFYLHEQPGGSELVIPPVYHREGTEPADVVFPVFWWWRGENWHTLVAGPVYHREDPHGYDFGIPPLVFDGRHDQSYYHVIPPILTFSWGSADEDWLFAGGLFYRFRQHDDEHWGVFPFVWVRNAPDEEYAFVPPLFFRWRNPEIDRTLHVVPPFYYQQDPHESFWGVAGLVHHDEGPGFHSTTIPPLLFHWSEEAATDEHPGSFRLSTPFFLYMNERGSETVVSWVYQRYRGVTEFDGVMPFYMHTFDPRDHSQTTMATPLVWNWSNPGQNNWAIVPFLLHLDDYGRSRLWITPLVGQFTNQETHDETTWVLPTIQVSRWHDGDAVNIHPLFYYESVPSHRHAVFMPFWWDFEHFENHTRHQVAFPFWVHVHEGNTDTHLVLTNYYRRREWANEGRWEWELHVSGLFDVGERSDGEHWWRILYGLLGYEHRLDHDRLWLFYMPIDFGHPVPPPAAVAPAAAAASFPGAISLD